MEARRRVSAVCYSIANAIEQLKGYRLRATLAGSGVCIGIATMVALNNLLGSGLISATEGMRKLGGDSVFIFPKDQVSMRGRAARPLTLDDAEALRTRKEYFSLVSPVFGIQGMMRACGERHVVDIYGVVPESHVLNGWALTDGRFVQELDMARRAPVAVVSADLAAQLPCQIEEARTVILSNQPFTVIGFVGSQGQFAGGESRNAVLIPLPTAESKYGAGIRDSLAIFARIRRGVPPELALDGARRLLRTRHGLGPTNAQDDFRFQTRDDLLSASFQQARTATVAIVLGLVITLTIAGIGIVNSVLTAVGERTSEIGLRRALGATRIQIAAQFIIESLLISVGGGLVGACVGYILSREVANILGLPPWANWQATAVAITAAGTLGLMAGLLPAIRAAELQPIDALRRE